MKPWTFNLCGRVCLRCWDSVAHERKRRACSLNFPHVKTVTLLDASPTFTAGSYASLVYLLPRPICTQPKPSSLALLLRLWLSVFSRPPLTHNKPCTGRAHTS